MERMVRLLVLCLFTTLTLGAFSCIEAEPDYGHRGSAPNTSVTQNNCVFVGGGFGYDPDNDSYGVPCTDPALSDDQRAECRRLEQSGVCTTVSAISAEHDCDSTRDDVHPGALEDECDNVDEDCDGEVDENDSTTEQGDLLPGCCHTDDQCADANSCTTDVCASSYSCISTLRADCCNMAVSCSGGLVCTSTTTQAGSCVACTADSDCDNGDYCNGAERCLVGNLCGAGADPCPTLECVEGMGCFNCITDNDCPSSHYCDTSTPMHMCEPVDCSNGGNACETGVAQNHTVMSCTYTWDAGCCRGAAYDADCQRPENLALQPSPMPVGYRWVCSSQPIASTGDHDCRIGYDPDEDGYPSPEWCVPDGIDNDADGLTDEEESPNACYDPPSSSPDAGVAPDSGAPDSGTMPDASVEDAGSSGCLPQQNCGVGFYWACSQCVVLVDQHGRTPSGTSGANAGPQADGTPDDWDDDCDCYCEVHTSQNPCLGSSSISCSVLLGGDCDDTQTGFGNHPGATDWPGDNYDNNCDGTWLP